jgi:hypothetical protein
MTTTTLGRRPFSDSSPDQGDSLSRGSSRPVGDPFCILVWKFAVEDVDVAEFAALCETSSELRGEQPKCLFQRITRGERDFRVHVGLEDAYGVLTHISMFADTLKKLGAVARYKGLEIHGDGGELADLRHPLERFRPLYVERRAEAVL